MEPVLSTTVRFLTRSRCGPAHYVTGSRNGR